MACCPRPVGGRPRLADSGHLLTRRDGHDVPAHAVDVARAGRIASAVGAVRVRRGSPATIRTRHQTARHERLAPRVDYRRSMGTTTLGEAVDTARRDAREVFAPFVAGPSDLKWHIANARRARRYLTTRRTLDPAAHYGLRWTLKHALERVQPSGAPEPVKWGRQRMWAHPLGIKRVHLHHLHHIVAATQPARILEVGCGPGQNTAILAALHPDAELHGVELTPEGVATGRQLTSGPLPEALRDFAPAPIPAGTRARVTFRQGSASDLPYPDGHFDLVYTMQSLEQMERIRRAALDEIVRVAASNVVMSNRLPTGTAHPCGVHASAHPTTSPHRCPTSPSTAFPSPASSTTYPTSRTTESSASPPQPEPRPSKLVRPRHDRLTGRHRRPTPQIDATHRATSTWPNLSTLSGRVRGGLPRSLHPGHVPGRRGPDRPVLQRRVGRSRAATDLVARTTGGVGPSHSLVNRLGRATGWELRRRLPSLASPESGGVRASGETPEGPDRPHRGERGTRGSWCERGDSNPHRE